MNPTCASIRLAREAKGGGRSLARSAWFCLSLGLAACGGGGGGGGGSAPPPPANVTVNGQVTFDRVPFSQTPGDGLDFNSRAESPARGVLVEIIDSASNDVLASTVTSDVDGSYSTSVPAERNVFVRVKARMQSSGAGASWEFEVRDNTSADALYAIDGSTFNTGSSGATRDLLAESGWDGTGYSQPRAAAPFAILDTLYQARELLVDARNDLAIGTLTVFWSESNRSSFTFCPADGNILTSLFLLESTNDCGVVSTSPTGIYLLGNYDVGDTDEFDQHVIAHEFGHFLENEISRTDSIGGEHAIGNRLDLRVAFTEGWGNAFAAIVLEDPVYRDSLRDAAGQFDVGFNIESDNVGTARGWYNEGSVHEILWDIYDDVPDVSVDSVSQGETVALGFGPIFDVLNDEQVTTSAFTSIYSFSAALRAANSVAAPGITGLLSDNQIVGSGDFAVGETNFPNPGPQGTPVLESDVLPIYTPIPLNQQLEVCGIRTFGTYNKVSNRRFLSFSLAQQRPISVTVIGLQGNDLLAPDPDPDFVIWRQGEVVEIADSPSVPPNPSDPPREQLDVMLDAGDYLLEVYEYSHVDPSPNAVRRARTCMTVSVTG